MTGAILDTGYLWAGLVPVLMEFTVYLLVCSFIHSLIHSFMHSFSLFLSHLLTIYRVLQVIRLGSGNTELTRAQALPLRSPQAYGGHGHRPR